ncbi:lytic polysaccharide monooxygenase [Actinoplanes sp. NBC_00393]|uniref:lytic polysaccharide monooxygenase auxiliary activity family 9 protein n=1 Tax=Actinoplanes sp. NBC_00393 TaxID=2975953 RepID=UPI002E1D6741
MSSLATPRRRITIAAIALSLLTFLLIDARPAEAHGSAIDPPSRHYECARRWDTDWQNPIMATQDPMCWQAWQGNPAAMWTWNGLIQDNVRDDHPARVPDGQLCGGGDPTYAALDTPGRWRARDVANTFTWTMHDQARHGAAYVRIYVSKQGFDPLTQRLRWSDLELVKDTGPFPAEGPTTTDPILNGVSYSYEISAPGRTGRHIVFAVWRAGHADQNYYMCSDVRFPGGTPDPTTPPPPPPGENDGCTARWSAAGQWAGGFQGDVTVTAGQAAIRGWTVTLVFPDGQTVGQSWNAQVTSDGPRVTARNVGYNGDLAAGATASFGVMGTWLGVNGAPALSCTATAR